MSFFFGTRSSKAAHATDGTARPAHPVAHTPVPGTSTKGGGKGYAPGLPAAPVSSMIVPPTLPPCSAAAGCVDFTPEHRRHFSHPAGVTMACLYGSKCYRRNLQHLQEYVHPGDRNYRVGMVHFAMRKGVQLTPAFSTLRELFNYCDPDESGNISQEEFVLAHSMLPRDLLGDSTDDVLAEWQEAIGPDHTHLTFAMFAKWANEKDIDLPVGLDVGEDTNRTCGFQYSGGERCPCSKYIESAQPNMCECCHKSSVHLSDTARMSYADQEILTKLRRKAVGARTGSANSRPSVGLGVLAVRTKPPGFDMISDKEVLADLQRLLTATHKESDNWTRDRGCALHGRHSCADSCVFSHRAPVPCAYELVRAERNRNIPLWQNFSTMRAGIKSEVEHAAVPFKDYKPLSALEVCIENNEPLDPSINEWRLLHGSKLSSIKEICKTNFRLKMAGTGATWKEKGKTGGTPLYGYGVYLAESITKADEYADTITEGLPIDVGCSAILVCRVVGGLCQLVDTNHFDTDDLRRDVFDGPYHSVFGDRVSKLGKPYREIVVYDHGQVFPEFIIYYKRVFQDS